MQAKKITREQIAARLDYNPQTGVFTWRTVLPFSSVRVGGVAGSMTSTGYIEIYIEFARYRAHHLAWVLTYGVWPNDLIDHVDGNRSNNAIANLREATKTTNAQNQRRAQRHNRLGILGVTQRKGDHAKPFQAMITVSGKAKYLGVFETAAEAHAAYLTAKRKLHEGCVI